MGLVDTNTTAEAGDSSLQIKVEILNKRGLHARAAAKFVKLVSQFDATIMVEKGGTSVSGSSIMGLMMLAAAQGSFIALTASGAEGEAALNAVIDLIERHFDEE